MKLKSATFVAQTKAVFTQLSSAASVTTLNRILASAQEGNFILFASLFDTFYIKDGAGASDGAVFDFFKTLTDDTAVADEATNSFMKSLAHTATFGDQIDFFAFGKFFQNTSAVTEAYTAHIQKPFSDGFSVAEDAASLHPNKVLFEAPAAVDAINTFGFGLGKFDTPITSDAHETTFGKLLQDTSSFEDGNTVSSEKLLADSVFATDDIDGEASILDDQEMQFVKQHTDIVGMSDFIQLGVVFTRDFVNNSALVDSISFSIAKPFSSSYAASDVLNVVTGKHVGDDGLALSDALTRTVSMVRADAASISDSHAAALSKVLSDTPSIADAGALRSHNYCDFAYFAEDYVGTSRTFT